MYARHAEIKVGLLVIAASVAMLGLLFYATGGDLWGDYRYVTMRLDPGRLAPQKGDPIQINGVKVGTVDEARLHTEERVGESLTEADRVRIDELRKENPDTPESIRQIYVRVVGKLPADQVLPVGTRGEIGESLTQTRLLILIPGDSPLNLTDEDTAMHPILVKEAPGLGSLAAKANDVMVKVEKAVDEATLTIIDVRATVNKVNEEIDEGLIAKIFEDVHETVSALRRASQGLEATLAEIGADVKTGVQDFKRLTASVARLAERLEQDVPAAVADVREVVAKVGGVVDRAAPKVDEFLDDVNRTGKNLVALSADFSGLGGDARTLVKELGGDLGILTDTLIDAGRNMLDASEDLRAHPWKLLNEPSADEIAYENLRNTMQNYVRAMQNMNATAQTLQAILQRGDAQNPTVRALLEKTLRDFNRSEERYRGAEKKLVELLQRGDGKAPRPNPSRPR